MTRISTLLVMLVPLLWGDVAGARARGIVKRAPKPKLLFSVKVEAAPTATAAQAQLQVALHGALAAEPLVITSLGLKKPTAGRRAWELRRRRLRWFAVTARLEGVTHKVVTTGGQKQLVAEATVSLAGKRKERFRKGTFAVKTTSRVATAVSVVLQGEILASRIAALRAAATKALGAAVKKLTAPKKRGRRR